MSTYYTILTNLGAALHANAQVMQTTVLWTHMCLGDGGGAPVVPVQTQTALKREVYRLPITDIALHPDNPNWLIVEAVVPSDVGGWTVRETALYGGAAGSQCIAVGNYPETYKPVLAEGAAREMVMRMVVEISSTATVKLSIDPAVAIASRAWVESLVATPKKRGLVQLATVGEAKEGVRGDVAVTPEGLDAALSEIGGLPRFTPYLWGGRADAMPQGDQQSSGQQLPDVLYPTMRAEVMATQFYCTEEEWQADPYKRVTHWSLGKDGWMRPPDKNGVQKGNVGAFYGVGSNPEGPLTGTALIDAMRNIIGEVGPADGAVGNNFLGDILIASGAFELKNKGTRAGMTDSGGTYGADALIFNAAKGLPAGTTTDPITGEFRPRSWYGIWMIRMYGRVSNPGALDAAGLNARMEMIDARVAMLEAGRPWVDVTAIRSLSVAYENVLPRPKEFAITLRATNGFDSCVVLCNEVEIFNGDPGIGTTSTSMQVYGKVNPGKSVSVTGSAGVVIGKWVESA